MREKLLTLITRLARRFDSASANKPCDETLSLWTKILGKIDAAMQAGDDSADLSRAKHYLLALQFLFETWATLGYQNSFVVGRVLVERAAAEVSNGYVIASIDRREPEPIPIRRLRRA